ncbi:MAG: DUF2461 domain-containing protein [Bacteroidota bacterium]
MDIIRKETLDFLKTLEANNNREWFTIHKNQFKTSEQEIKLFYEALKQLMGRHDVIEKVKAFRIYRDVRFSKDKTPYKNQFAASFSRAGAERRGGYYLCIKPGGSFIATGFWNPNKEDLFRIRKELETDALPFRKVVTDTNFTNTWGVLLGDAVKTAPKGFDSTHQDIDLIRQKQFLFTRNFTDKQVLSSDFIKEIDMSFQAIRPYFDLMSEVLTTNLNGESIL